MPNEAFLAQIEIDLVSLVESISFFLQWRAYIALNGNLRNLLARVFGIRFLFCNFSDLNQVQMLKVVFHRARSHIQQRHRLLLRAAQTKHSFATSHRLTFKLFGTFNVMELCRLIDKGLSTILARVNLANVNWDGRDYCLVDFEVVSRLLPSFLPQLIKLSDLHESFKLVFFCFKVEHKLGSELRWFGIINL